MQENHMPLIGLGTWKLYGDECESVVRQALEMGYQHIDTADEYQNHQAIGNAIQKMPREKIFLTTKLSMKELEPQKVEQAVPRFLKELKVDYIDLLLIHWPNPNVDLIQTLQTMLLQRDKGWVRFIGVSNFVRRHLDLIAPYQFPIFTNQIELHPYLQRQLLIEACKKQKIAITAYRPLAKGAFEDDHVLQTIGNKYHKSPSQIVLRWLTQQGHYAIPKASSLQHLKDNLNVFDFKLDESELQHIQHLDIGKRFCSPSGYPIEND